MSVPAMGSGAICQTARLRLQLKATVGRLFCYAVTLSPEISSTNAMQTNLRLLYKKIRQRKFPGRSGSRMLPGNGSDTEDAIEKIEWVPARRLDPGMRCMEI